MSMIPMTGNKLAPNPWLVDNLPQIYMGMGMTAECVRKKYGITREDADRIRSAAATRMRLKRRRPAISTRRSSRLKWRARSSMAKPKRVKTTFSKDEGPRAETSLEALAKLRPAFHDRRHRHRRQFFTDQRWRGGRDRHVREEGARNSGSSRWFASSASPLAAFRRKLWASVRWWRFPKALKLAGLKLDDIECIELNEAFAVQALAVIREAGLDPEKVNVNGGAIALGHPLGCTGAKLTATILREMKRRNAKYGMVSMCIGGGQGAAGIFENLN